MIHDPCIVPQLRSKKREHDDWFLLQMGCFDSDGNKGEGSGKGGASDLGDAGEAIASDFVDPYDQDEAADYADRMSASTGAGGTNIGDNQTRAVNIPNISAGRGPDINFDEEADRDESPLSFFEDVTAKQARERREKERGIREAVKQEEYLNMLDSLPDVDLDEPEGGAAAGLDSFRSDIFGDVDPFDSMGPVDLDEIPGGAVGLPENLRAGNPAKAQLQAVGKQAFRGARPKSGGSGAQTVDDTTVPTAQSMQGVVGSSPNFGDLFDSTITRPSAMTMAGVGAAGPNEPYLSEDVINEIKKQAEQPPRDEGLGAVLRPGSLVSNVLGDLTNRNAAFAREVTRPGNQFQRDAQGNITGVYNPQSNSVFTPESVGMFDLPAQEAAAGDLYNIQRAEQENRMGRAGDDVDPAPPVVPPGPTGCPDGYEFNSETGSCEYKGVSYAGIGQGQGTVNLGPYTPATQYTGIAGLEPFVLRPTPGTLDLTPKYRFPDTST